MLISMKKGMNILRIYANRNYNILILLNVLLLKKCIVIDYFLGQLEKLTYWDSLI